MNKIQLGTIKIEDLPKINKEEIEETGLPLLEKLTEAVQNTSYANESNTAHLLAHHLHKKGGEIYYSKEACSEYGLPTVERAFKYFKALNDNKDLDTYLKISIQAWIADNIFDTNRMIEKFRE